MKLQTVSAACMVEARRLPPGDHGDSICVGNLQPDLVLVSPSLKRIGLLDLCRPFDSLGIAFCSSPAETTQQVPSENQIHQSGIKRKDSTGAA